MLNATVNRAFFLDVGRAAMVNVCFGATVFIILVSASTLWAGAATLDFVSWLWVALLAAPSNASILFPGAVLVAVVSTMRRWTQEGAWLGLNALGVGGRGLFRPVLQIGLLVVGVTALSTLILEPALR